MGAESSYEFDCLGDNWVALGGREEVARFRSQWEKLSHLERRKAQEIARLERQYNEAKLEMMRAGLKHHHELAELKAQYEVKMKVKVEELRMHYESRLAAAEAKNQQQAKNHEAIVKGLKEAHQINIAEAVRKETASLEARMDARFGHTDSTLSEILKYMSSQAGINGKGDKSSCSTRRPSNASDSSQGSGFRSIG